jgi:hypothetical protein
MIPALLYTYCPGEIEPVFDADVDAADIVDADWPQPEPCCHCGRPASPYLETVHGPLCWRCWGPDGPPARPGRADGLDGARARWRDTVLSRTFLRLAACRLARDLRPVIAPVSGGW